MSEARAQRDRRLIARTAALLSEDYPLDQLIARLCEALTSELGAAMAFVALSDDLTQPLRVSAVCGLHAGAVDKSSAVAEGTPAYSAYLAGTPIAISDKNDLRAYARGADLDIASGIFVPILYGERTLGVLAICSERPGAFDEQDVRMVTAIARYLGIAVRNQGASSATTVRRGNALPYAIVISIAFVLSSFIWAFAGARIQEFDALARERATSQLSATAAALSDYIDVSAQLAATGSELFSVMPHDRRVVEATLVQLLHSAQSPSVYGLGVWYQPYRFAPDLRLYGPYANRLHQPQIRVTNQWMRRSYNFPAHPWYQLGIAANGATAYTEPYFDTDFTYVSAVRAFRGPGGAVEGVVTVDSTMPHLESIVHSSYPNSLLSVTSSGGAVLFTSDDHAFREYSARHGIPVRAVSAIPQDFFAPFLTEQTGDDVERFSSTLPLTGWKLNLAVNRDVLFAESRRTRAAVTGVIVLLWLAALAVLVTLRYARHSDARATNLEREQVELTREIADRKKAEERLRERAYRDELTRLPNRAFVLGELGRSLDALRLDGEGRFAVFFIDLDRFNLINDSLGHETGDLLLAEIAQRLRDVSGDRVVARLGGDEFIVLMPGAGEAEAVEAAEKVLAAVSRPFSVSGHELFVSASAGVALADVHYTMPEEILRDADAAMYEAKRAGRATVRVFDQSMHTRAMEALALESDLRQGLPRKQVYAVYQPIVALLDERVVGFEALARWQHPVRGLVPTEDFIRVAEQTGLIADIDETIISQACSVAGSWLDEFPDLYLSVNVSPAHLMRVDDLAVVRRVLEQTGFPAASLRAELTETAVMERGVKAEAIFRQLRELGVAVMVDDFGTGYSSLGYLQRLPLKGLKIDRSFVSEMMRDEKAAEIVRAIMAIAKALGLHVVAEGTETREEVEALRAMGVEYAQGYFFSRPLDAQAALAFVRESRVELSKRVP
jgi:diguanylate cyclase (GGDEF)-like protein